MPALGISRVTEITHLDHLLLPVFLSHRPGGKTLRVHAGKGLSTADARAGALMEAVEYAISERHASAGADLSLPLRDLTAALPPPLALVDFAPRLGVAIDWAAPTRAVHCEEITSGTSAVLPAELVLMPFEHRGAPPLFGWSTNGLASGNTLNEATLHALFEVLERDALAMNIAEDRSNKVSNASLPAPFRGLAADWTRLGIELFVRFVPNALGLPCFEAALHQSGSRKLRMSRGWGIHFHRRIALVRAICEAAQTRLVAMRRRCHAMELPQAERFLARLLSPRRAMPFEDAPDFPFRSVDSALKALLARLAGKGFVHVFRRQMPVRVDGFARNELHVVKIVVPRCEFAAGAHMRMGPRLIELAFGKQPSSGAG
jgi:ribosomal protein S12 methylthiotransferase accessory factor